MRRATRLMNNDESAKLLSRSGVVVRQSARRSGTGALLRGMFGRAAILAVFALALAGPASAAAAPGDEAVYGLVHGCYGLRSVDAGKFVVKSGDRSYAATSDTVGGAEPLRMHATTLGQYLLFGKAEDFLAAGSGDAVTVAGQPGPSGDWKVSPSGGAFRLTNAGNGRALGVGEGGRLRTLTGSGSRFTFEPAQGCATFPEAEVNVSGEPTRGATASARSAASPTCTCTGWRSSSSAAARTAAGRGARTASPWRWSTARTTSPTAPARCSRTASRRRRSR